jgi:hypothetical protein
MKDGELTMNELMGEIRETTKKQKSASRVDEIRVMKTMLNDPDFSVSIYDKNKGLIGQRCPHEEAVKFLANTTSAITGLDAKNAAELASKYEFTKKDAIFMVENSRDFVQTYLSTGRKLPIAQTEDTEASLFYRAVPSKEKVVPGAQKTTTIPSFNKVICKSKSPKYHSFDSEK